MYKEYTPEIAKNRLVNMPLLITENLCKLVYKLDTPLNIFYKLASCFGILVYASLKYTFNFLALLNILQASRFYVLFL